MSDHQSFWLKVAGTVVASSIMGGAAWAFAQSKDHATLVQKVVALEESRKAEAEDRKQLVKTVHDLDTSVRLMLARMDAHTSAAPAHAEKKGK
ncbi:MAG: hypothetical protein ACRCXD_01645 [Luteolibacter sp.]